MCQNFHKKDEIAATKAMQESTVLLYIDNHSLTPSLTPQYEGRDFPHGKSLVDCVVCSAPMQRLAKNMWQQLLGVIFFLATRLKYLGAVFWIRERSIARMHFKRFSRKECGGKTFVWTECKIWARKMSDIFSCGQKGEMCECLPEDGKQYSSANNILQQTISPPVHCTRNI